MCVLCGTMVLQSTFLLDQHSGGGMHAMLGTLPRMLVSSPVILFQLGSVIKGTLEKCVAFYLKNSSTLLHTLVSPSQVTTCAMRDGIFCQGGCQVLN